MIGKKPGLGPPTSEATSVIGEGSVFEGTMEITGNLRVDGAFKGKLRISENLIVGKRGSVEAEVQTRSALIGGTIKGNLNAAEKIALQSGSRLEGEMVTSKLVIEEGVSFQGSCNTAQSTSRTTTQTTHSTTAEREARNRETASEEVEAGRELANRK
jgi:cytoskeletal protein CcmA (bactofilin family)